MKYIFFFLGPNKIREYVALEGRDEHVTISLERDANFALGALYIGYSTSDLTAHGIDKEKFSECLKMSVYERRGCGDYEQSSGKVMFRAGRIHTSFQVQIINDLCKEEHSEYIQLNLHIPGGGPIHGENYRAQIRIDDNDWDERTDGFTSALNCKRGID